jgi:acetyl esterase/lipase
MIISQWFISITVLVFHFIAPTEPYHSIQQSMSEQKNVAYISKDNKEFDSQKHVLDMYWPAVREKCPIVIFIHGGTWISGSKDLYSELGRHLAAKGMTTAIINYRLGDAVQYHKMAEDCAAAVKWVHNHASQYNGDPQKVITFGHSAGAHLAALISLDQDYFLNYSNPIKACMLIDAFGLNIDTFIQSPLAQQYRFYIEKVFTNDPSQWKKASPASFVGGNKIPFFIATGNNSYPFLLLDNQLFINKLKATHADVTYEKIAGKNHAEMITQLKELNNPLYAKMMNFIHDKLP